MENENYDFKKELKHDWFLLVLIMALFIISVFIYSELPEEMAMHWNLEGEADNFMGRFWGAFMMPLLSLGILLAMILFPLIDPRRENYTKFKQSYRLIRLGLILFLAVIHIASLGINLGYNIDIGKVVSLGLGVLFIIIGNYMPKIKHNYFLGIKVPWTLASEKVWRKTHRMSGKLFVLSGIIILLSVFIEDKIRFWIVIVCVIGSLLAGIIYSYLVYREEEK